MYPPLVVKGLIYSLRMKSEAGIKGFKEQDSSSCLNLAVPRVGDK